MSSYPKPVIGVVSCRKELLGHHYQAINEMYLAAIRAYGGLPVPFTAGSCEADLKQLLQMVDGILLPGSISNVAPHHYGAKHHEPRQDEGRDQLSLTLIRLCASKGIPIMGICRGFQEMNVAMGGSLHPEVHQLNGFRDHRQPDSDDFSIRYAPVHPVQISHHGLFIQWLDGINQIDVNSLHGQGIDQLATSLQPEAWADDGLVEAFCKQDHPFFVAVQWHPEYQSMQQPFSQQLFRRFIDASKSYSRR